MKTKYCPWNRLFRFVYNKISSDNLFKEKKYGGKEFLRKDVSMIMTRGKKEIVREQE